MKIEEFREWLKNQGYKPNVVNARVGNCITVSNYEGDLDILFAKDECRDLINRLNYSAEDEKNNAPVRHKVHINGNKRKGSATLKQAVKLYVRFLNNETFSVKVPLSDSIIKNILTFGFPLTSTSFLVAFFPSLIV